MGSIIIGLCVLALFLFALRKTIRHLRGEEDCCGGCGGSCCHCNTRLSESCKQSKEHKGESK